MVAVVLVVLTVTGVATTAWWAAGGDDAGRAPSGADPSSTSPTTSPATSPTTTPATTPAGSPTGSTSSPPPPTFTVTARPGTPAGSQARTQPPETVTLPSRTSVPVRVASTSASGLLRVPDDVTVAGWWDGGARLGDTYGPMVVASHVDSAAQGIGPFAELLEVSAGDRVTVTSSGLTQRFSVATVELVPKTELETSDALVLDAGGDPAGAHHLRGPIRPRPWWLPGPRGGHRHADRAGDVGLRRAVGLPSGWDQAFSQMSGFFLLGCTRGGSPGIFGVRTG